MDADGVSLPLWRVGRPAAPRGDAALVRAAAGGDTGAQAELFRRHWKRAHQAAWLVTHDAQAAEDVAQEAFLAAFGRLETFDRSRPFAPWLHRIVVNRAIDHTRARRARREVGDRVEGTAPPAPETHPEVLAALGELAPEQRAVVVLRHLLGYTPSEIAELLELPRGTVNSRLRRALDALAGQLAEGKR